MTVFACKEKTLKKCVEYLQFHHKKGLINLLFIFNRKDVSDDTLALFLTHFDVGRYLEYSVQIKLFENEQLFNLTPE